MLAKHRLAYCGSDGSYALVTHVASEGNSEKFQFAKRQGTDNEKRTQHIRRNTQYQ
jgi:hypothetical protein